MKKVTIDELRRTAWWWQRKNGIWEFDPATTMTRIKAVPAGATQSAFKCGYWKQGVERTAWAYELARRAKRAPALPPFVDLSDAQAAALFDLWGDRAERTFTWTESPYRLEAAPGHTYPVMFNLNASDHALIESFKIFLADQRRIHGIRPKRFSRGTKSSQGPRWDWVQLLDLDRHGLRGKCALARNAQTAYARPEAWPERRFLEARAAASRFFEQLRYAKPREFTGLLD
ncbi:MAG TPA: hypothetical protein P5233_18595 [Candidatus Paceibacterota bacterium]|nr:hypothetical protein [Candidatus Paceibacterota bacterium]